MPKETNRTLAIIGAGPVGLAAASHALARGIEPVVFEAGPAAGHAVRQWSHVRMFSPWQYNVDKEAGQLLATMGWTAPDPQAYPTGGELVSLYLEPLATRTFLNRHIKTNSEVIAISRAGFDRVKTRGRDAAPFEIRYRNGKGPETLRADAVIDTSGTWSTPAPAGGNGLAAIGEENVKSRIAYGMPDVLGSARERYAGNTVAVLGAGHSAIGTLIDLVKLKSEAPGTEVIWLLRGDRPEKAFGGGANDKLAARGELGSTFARFVREGAIRIEKEFAVSHLAERGEQLRIGAGSACCGRHVVVDQLIIATGFRPDFSFARELRLALDPVLECPPALAPLIDPNEHSCGTVRPHGARELAQPESGFYIAGMKSYGRAPTFLMLTGYEQVRSIIADIAGDKEAAARVELVLPETGVCTGATTSDTEADCCGGPAITLASACCRSDEDAKQAGAEGCGCGTAPAVTPLPAKCCG